MDTDREIETTPLIETLPAFNMGNLDPETIEILVDDKIATGG